MAIQLVSAIKRYIGTAAEVAAFPLAGLPVGSTFFESDTGILKILDQSGALVNAPSESSVVQLSGSNMELYGATTATRPAATAVAVGTTFTVCNASLDTTISDGTNWVAI